MCDLHCRIATEIISPYCVIGRIDKIITISISGRTTAGHAEITLPCQIIGSVNITIAIVVSGSNGESLRARAYAKARKADGTLANHIIGSESDFGAGPVYGLQSSNNISPSALHVVDTMASLMGKLGVTRRSGSTYGGPDMIPLSKLGVPALGMMQDGTDYFDLHHTPDDTFDKVNPEHMRQNLATWTIFTFIAAEWPGYFR